MFIVCQHLSYHITIAVYSRLLPLRSYWLCKAREMPPRRSYGSILVHWTFWNCICLQGMNNIKWNTPSISGVYWTFRFPWISNGRNMERAWKCVRMALWNQGLGISVKYCYSTKSSKWLATRNCEWNYCWVYW